MADAVADFAGLLIVIVHHTQPAGHLTDTWLKCPDPLCAEARKVLGYSEQFDGPECDCPCHAVIQPGLVPCPRCDEEKVR